MTCHGRAGTCLFLLAFFGASILAFLRISCSVELCLPYPELRFLVFCRIRFCRDGSYGFRARKIFSIALFLVVSGRLVSGPVFSSISGISIFAFLSGILFNGTCLAKTAPEKFCGHSMFGFLSVWRLCGGCFAIFGGQIFVLVLVVFASCSVCAVRFYVACVALAALLFSLLFSSPRLSPLGGRPGRGPPSLLRFSPVLLRSPVPPLEAGAVT